MTKIVNFYFPDMLDPIDPMAQRRCQGTLEICKKALQCFQRCTCNPASAGFVWQEINPPSATLYPWPKGKIETKVGIGNK